MYDQADRLALESEISFTVIGRGAEFILIDNSAPEDSSNLLARARQCGWAYTGVFGLQDGVPCVVSEPDPASQHTMMHAGLVFCRVVADRLHSATKGDSVNWLRQLHSLPDTRA
jgi:hypothetical protein